MQHKENSVVCDLKEIKKNPPCVSTTNCCIENVTNKVYYC